MSLHDELATLVAVAGSASFAAAARRLSLSPAMVGRRIQALEDRYGAKLIERTTRSHRLTPVGRRALDKATEIVRAVEELDELARVDARELSGRVRMSAPTTLGIRRIAAIVAAMSAEHPDLVVELGLGDERVDLVSAGIDLAVRIGELPSSSLVARQVGSYGFVCCAAPAHLAREGTPSTPHELGAARCVLNLNLVPRERWPFHDAAGERFTVEVRGTLKIDKSTTARRSARPRWPGIIYAPRELVADDLAASVLVDVLPEWRTIELPIHIVHPSRTMVPRRVSAVIDALAAGLREGGREPTDPARPGNSVN